jgi:fatty acid desaturase
MPNRLCWSTLCVACVILGGFIVWSLCFNQLPLWLSAPSGAVLLTWYGSLQHETIHGHPTRSRRINHAIGGLPLSLWVPYAIYRQTHIQHHRQSGRRLTEVGHDPESFYLPPGHLAKVGTLRRFILQANCTLIGRLTLGPAIAIGTFWWEQMHEARTDRRSRRIWIQHAMATAVLLGWVCGVCHIPLLAYLFLVVYPSVSLTHLRSFAEHRADDHSPLRTNVVEAHPFWALIFMNNNLHVAHHAHPHVPWHQLPQLWQGMRHSAIPLGRVFRGYGEVTREYLFQPFITPEHPFARGD